MLRWGDLFTARQKFALVSLARSRLSSEVPYLRHPWAIVVNRIADRGSSVCRWDSSTTSEVVKNTFSRQALPVVWDFAEINLFSASTGSFDSVIDFVANVVTSCQSLRPAQTQLGDATVLPLVDASAHVWFTDPPYYDAVPYADLSDFFFVWLKRTLPGHPLLRDPFDSGNMLTPKEREVVQDETKTYEGRPKDRAFFEQAMARAFTEGARVLREDGVAAVVFAHKTTEGWEALLSGMIRGGWVITASWPITTEMGTRLRARESAALSASVHLVCRPRDAKASVGDWGDVFGALPNRIQDWMDRLSSEGIRGADLVFACIGPALELFSRYERVETPDGETVGLAANPDARSEPARRGYLSYVWEAVGRTALARVLAGGGNGGAGMLEEDARLTALFLWTVQSTELTQETPRDSEGPDEEDPDDDGDEEPRPGRKKGLTLIYDVARRFAQPLGIHLDQWEGRIIETEKGVVRLLPVRERTEQLFGRQGASAVARRVVTAARAGRAPLQGILFPDLEAARDQPRRRRGGQRQEAELRGEQVVETRRDATTLDRVHAAMLFQASGASAALRELLAAEIARGPDFLRLAEALTALYPKDSEEKRLLDAMLLAVPR
jgi:hypothetical protein